MKIYAIGDIHGCYDEMIEMLDIIDKRINPDDVILFLGDYIDRGPKSFEVVDHIVNLQKTSKNPVVTLMGNHEDMAMHDPGSFVLNGGYDTLHSYHNNGHKDLKVHIDFYTNLKPYAQYGKYVFVHAGIDPSLELRDQNYQNMIWTRRYVGYDGEYKGGYFVVFGHTPGDGIRKAANQVCIDTACVFGRKLSCAVVDVTNNEINYIQVKAKENYYK